MGERFDSLDGMRGVCAFIVLVYHCDAVLNTQHLINQGWLCVDAFFALSGFVIAHRYESVLATKGGLRKYVWARLRRLVPTMMLGHLFSALCLSVLYLKGIGLWREVPLLVFAGATVLGMLLIPLSLTPFRLYSAFMGEDYPLDPPLWSLFSEVVANAAYGLVLHAVRSRVLAGIILVLWIVLFGRSLHSPEGWEVRELVPGAARALSEFLAGVILLRLFRAGRLDAIPSINPVLIFSLWFFVCCIPYRPSMSLFSGLIATIGVPLAMMFLIRTEHRTPKLFSWLGYVSYPLYVSHFGFIWIALMFLPHDVKRHNVLWAIPIIVGALCLAWVIAKLTETPRKGQPVVPLYAT